LQSEEESLDSKQRNTQDRLTVTAHTHEYIKSINPFSTSAVITQSWNTGNGC